MCDYSLEYVASRPAKVGDRLVSIEFPQTITRSFAAAGDLNVAVCLMPGTEVAFDREVEYEHPVTYARQRTEATVARFREINTNQLMAHHDALEFPSGQIVLLTRLVQGQCATVLQLPAASRDHEDGASVDTGTQAKLPLTA
jgi:hypothetical protein